MKSGRRLHTTFNQACKTLRSRHGHNWGVKILGMAEGRGGGGRRESWGGGRRGARHGTEAMERVLCTPISKTVALHSEGLVYPPLRSS